MKKQLLSTLMALCLCLTLVPLALTTAASATGTAVTYNEIDGTKGNTGEDYTNLLDGKNSEGDFTKWCVEDATCGAYVVIMASSAVTLESYTFITGNDTAANPGRNPKAWNVYGSNDYNKSTKDGTWTMVHKVRDYDEMPAENFASRTFSVTSDTAYQYFKFEITEIVSDNLFQLCGISLSGSADSGAAAAVSPDYSWYDESENEFTVTTAAQLLGFANLVNGSDGKTATNFEGKTVKLGADIDLSGIANWTPIGKNGALFGGTFDGQGKTISKLTVNSTGQSNYVGLFGRTVGATVQNLAVSGSVSGTGTYSEVGGIVGSLGGGSIKNCSFSGSVTGNGNYVGGIAGETSGNPIENCSVSGSVTGSGSNCRVGGIAGLSGSGLISKCKNTATVSGSGSAQALGGIVGDIGHDIKIRYCCNQGELTNYGWYVGGLVGRLTGVYSAIPLRSCYTTFDVNGHGERGSAIGYVDNDNPITVSGIYIPVPANEETSWVGRIEGSDTTIIGEGESKSTDAFASGEVAWLLQNAADASDGQVWGQTLTGGDKDAYPVLADKSGSNTVYKVTFVDDGVSTVKYLNGGTITVSNPTKDDYAFGGWYTAATGGTKVTAITSALCDTGDGADANSITLYARWVCAGAHTGGTADCSHKAICTACGEPYGDYGAHNFTIENKSATGALKTAGNCQTEAVYYKSCSVCGAVSTNDADTFKGDKDTTTHTGTKTWSTKNATQHEQTWSCCGAVVVALENHEWKNGACEECGYVCLHTGGTADCSHKAICTTCGEPYGDYGAHSFTVENKSATGALKTAGDCQTEAVYYKSCSVCGAVSTNDADTFKGDKDTTTHTGGTELVGKKDAKCAEDGYTGDTYCLGCNNKLSDGTVIPATGAHSYTVESKSATGALKTAGNCQTEAVYYKSCSVCGAVSTNDTDTFKGDKDTTTHTGTKTWSTKNATQHEQTWSCCGAVVVALENHEWKDGACEECGYICLHTGGTADCSHKAVCTTCGEPYGDYGAHSYTVENKSASTLKTAGNCQTEAVYFKSCSVCGAVSTNDADTFKGDKDTTTHTGTKTWSTKNATQHEQTWSCCGAVVVALENHDWKDGACEECGYICLHTGGTADCSHKAVCTTCGEPYGDYGTHSYTVENKSATGALKSAGNCQTEAVYYKSCSVCGAVSTNDADTFKGDKDTTTHTGTKTWSTKNATQHEQTWSCCGAVVVALENHEWKDGACEECGYICLHTGGTADCSHKAVCTTCGEPYGEVDTTIHTGALGDWQKDENGHWKTYSCCPTVKGDEGAHSFGADGKCVCGAVCYTVTFDANGGTVGTATDTTDISGKLAALPAPTRSGSYQFNGWFTEKTGGTEITADTVFAANTTVYAQWTHTGGSSDRPHSATVSDAKNGTVNVSPRYAERGDIVTITVTPDKGYVLETLTILDKNGNAIELTDLGGGKYTFTMPAGKVSVEATFMDDNTMLNFFTDVPMDAYYYDAVLWATDSSVTTGTSATTFSPDMTCTRAQIVTFLYRAAVAQGADVSVGEDTNILSYTDALEIPEYAFAAFQWACGAGIVQGADGKLMPNGDCTRMQIVTMLYRYAVATGKAVSVGEDTNILSYTDALEIPEYAFAAFQWACGAGIVQGADGKLMPSVSCTRAQIVTMLYRSVAK